MKSGVWIAGSAAALAWLAFGIHYAFDHRAMFAPYGDTGGDVLSTGVVAASITSLRSLLSLFSWQPWDYSAFTYLSMGPFVFSVPLQLIVHDAFTSVKLVYVLQFTVAFVGTAVLYSELLGRSAWRWLAAAMYVVIPLMSLQTRLMGFGWVAALVPVALAGNLWLARRYGWRASPAIGVVCGLASAAFAIEYAIFVGLPLLALSLSIARWKGIRINLWWAAAASVAFILLPAYTALISIFGHDLMDWISATQAIPSQLDLFSQTLGDQVANILREATISGDPALNASPDLPLASAAGAIIWLLSLTALGFAIANGTWRRWWPIVAIAGVCFVLSLGPEFPVVGSVLWKFFARLPVLRSLRTPDRFEQVNALLVVLAAAYASSLLSKRGRVTTVVAAIVGMLSVCTYFAFDVRQHVLGLQAVDERLPDFDAATHAVERLGGRTAIFAFPLRGSQYDWAPYAPDAARVSFAWDLAGRFARTDGGVALLRRASVRSIVTTPNWTRVSESGLPADMADLVAPSPYAHLVASFPQGVSVYSIDARPMVSQIQPACIYAGPAAFELAAALRSFESFALIHANGKTCSREIFADFDPLDEALPASAAARWDGADLFGASPPLPIPYAFVVDRFGIAAPWYRNAYRGDSLLSLRPFQTYGYSSTTLVFTVARKAHYAVYVRMSGLATLQSSTATGRQVVAQSRRVEGFSWVKLDLDELGAGSYQLPLEVVDAPEADLPAVIDTVIVARAHEPNIPGHPQYTVLSMRAFRPPVAVRSYQYLFPRPSNKGITAETQSVTLGPGTDIGLVGGEARISAKGRLGRARFRWMGKTDHYVVVAAGWFNEQAPTMTLRSGDRALQIRYDPSTGIAPSSGYAQMDLVHGANVDVTLDARPGGIASLTQITAMPVQQEETPTTYDESSETWQFAKNDPMQFYEAIHSADVALAGGSIRAFPGATAEIPFDPVFVGGHVTADVQVTGGRGSAELRCGDAVDRSDLGSGSENPGGAALVVERENEASCTLRIEWKSETLALESVLIHAHGALLADWNASQYISHGTYQWDGSHGINLSLDGRTWRKSERLTLASGTHVLTLRRAPVGMVPLVIRSVSARSAAPPAIDVNQQSATSWIIGAPTSGTLELAQFDDGNWYAQSGSTRVGGYTCDLVNTCFDIGVGTILVNRTIPPILAVGLTVTTADVAVALLVLFFPEILAWWRRAERPPAAMNAELR